MRKRFIWIPLVLLISVVVSGVSILWKSKSENLNPLWPSIRIPTIACPTDKDGDGIDDLTDIVGGAKAEVQRKPHYRDAYYQKGYPPESEGVCTDVVWRAFRDAGYDLKGLVIFGQTWAYILGYRENRILISIFGACRILLSSFNGTLRN